MSGKSQDIFRKVARKFSTVVSRRTYKVQHAEATDQYQLADNIFQQGPLALTKASKDC